MLPNNNTTGALFGGMLKRGDDYYVSGRRIASVKPRIRIKGRLVRLFINRTRGPMKKYLNE